MLSCLPPRGGVRDTEQGKAVFLPGMESRPAWGCRAAAGAGTVPAACWGAGEKPCPQAGLPTPMRPAAPSKRCKIPLDYKPSPDGKPAAAPGSLSPLPDVPRGAHAFLRSQIHLVSISNPEYWNTSRGMGLRPAGCAASPWPSGPLRDA